MESAGLEQELEAINNQQKKIRLEQNIEPPQWIAHGTHMQPEDYKSMYPHLAGKVLPAFPKHTQNELNLFKKHGENSSQDIPAPKRVFGITTKLDDHNQPLLDEQGRPVPQDGSYAYALKKCSASITFVDGQTPLLTGFADKYKDFADGTQKGHIYVGKGDNFIPEFDEHRNITEYISPADMPIAFHYEVTPAVAMEHNAQFVMFKDEKSYNDYAGRCQFSTFITSDSAMLQLLANEIEQGRATYINATERGANPKLEVLQKAQKQRDIKERINKNKARLSPSAETTDIKTLRGLSEPIQTPLKSPPKISLSAHKRYFKKNGQNG